MKIELNTYEIWDLLSEGSTNQRNFINSLSFSEFEEFLDFLEDYEVDLRSLLNGGCLSVEDGPVKDYVIWENGRVSIIWYI